MKRKNKQHLFEWVVKAKQYAIGIDPGTKTGVAVWDIAKQEFAAIKTMKIHKAMEFVSEYANYDVIIRVEDAWLRTRPPRGNGRLQGVGSIKRDSTIWIDFLKDLCKNKPNINVDLVAPIHIRTKLTEEQFYNITKYKGVTSSHARDASMLVFGLL